MSGTERVEAGDFDTWLEDILKSFKEGIGVNVPCGDCRGCCNAGRFIHLLPTDRKSFSAIPSGLLFKAPGMANGHAVMGYVDGGACPMLVERNCSIYASRPYTCKAFDCRVMTAAGLAMQGQWAERINDRVVAWEFSYSSPESRRRHDAIRKAALFIQKNASSFPNGRAPSQPTDIAVLAIKTHSVFLQQRGNSTPVALANDIVAKHKEYENS
jgi:Fe-S-cluster containining protein